MKRVDVTALDRKSEEEAVCCIGQIATGASCEPAKHLFAFNLEDDPRGRGQPLPQNVCLFVPLPSHHPRVGSAISTPVITRTLITARIPFQNGSRG